jgi:hypothetical protein
MHVAKPFLRAFGATILVVAGVAALPQAARAELVFDRGPDVYAANDDGSNLHPLVRASWLGMDNGLWTPAVAPNGTVVTFMGETLRNDVQDPNGDGTHYYGSSMDGVYALSGGNIARLTPDPAPAGYSSGGDIDPEPVAGGQYAFQHWSCTEVHGQFGWDNYCEHAMFTAPLSQGALASTAFGECATAADPTQDPSTSTLRLAYGGCTYNADPNDFLSEDRESIYVSGAGHQGEHAIALGEDAGQTGGLIDPSFSPDGRQVVAYDTGGGRDDFSRQNPHFTVAPALRVFDSAAAQPSEGRILVEAPTDAGGHYVTLESPRYISAGTIAFTADGSIWTVPADCDDCTMDDATELVPGSFDDDTGIGAVAWTSKTVQPGTAPPPPPQGGTGNGGGGTGGGGGGTGGTGATPQPQPQPTPIPQPAPAPASPSLKLPGGTLKVKHGKLRVSLGCGAGTTSCKGTLVLIRGKGKRASSLGHVAYTISAGRKKTLTLKLTRAGRRALAKARGHKLKVTLTAKPATGKATSRSIALKG